MKEASLKLYTVTISIYVTFRKRQNYEGGEQISDCQVLRVGGELIARGSVLGVIELFCILIVMFICPCIFKFIGPYTKIVIPLLHLIKKIKQLYSLFLSQKQAGKQTKPSL